MGRVRFRGEASGKVFGLKETTAGVVEVYDETDNNTLAKIDSTTIEDFGGVKLNSHGSRHKYGGDDAIPTDGLQYSQIKVAFGSEITAGVSAGGTYTIPEGMYYVKCGANTRIEVYFSGSRTWETVIANGGVGLVASDGSNVRAYNVGGIAEPLYLKPFA